MKKLTSTILIGGFVAAAFATSAVAATKHSKYFSDSELRSMDTNQDNLVSKDEFLTYNGLSFDKMKLTDGMIVLKRKSKTNSDSKSTDNSSSMNNKPIGTTSDNPNVNERDAVNGKNF